MQITEVWSPGSKREINYALANDRKTLIWFANQRAVELHIPLLTVGTDEPSYLVMDLDPPEVATSDRSSRLRSWCTEHPTTAASKPP